MDFKSANIACCKNGSREYKFMTQSYQQRVLSDTFFKPLGSSSNISKLNFFSVAAHYLLNFIVSFCASKGAPTENFNLLLLISALTEKDNVYRIYPNIIIFLTLLQLPALVASYQ